MPTSQYIVRAMRFRLPTTAAADLIKTSLRKSKLFFSLIRFVGGDRVYWLIRTEHGMNLSKIYSQLMSDRKTGR